MKQTRKRGTPSEFYKECPKCKRVIYFCDKYRLQDSIDKNRECNSCSKKENKNPQYGRVYTEEERKYYGRLVKNSPEYKRFHKSGRSAEISRNLVIKRIMEYGIPIGVNKKSCKFFDKLNEMMEWKGKHAFNNETKMEHKELGYLLDYYEPNLNVIIEWDEERHYYRNGKLKENDIRRQINLMNKLKCGFYRIREKTKEVKKIDNLQSDYTNDIRKILDEYQVN